MDEEDDDVQIVKVEKTKKKQLQWVSSSFGDFGSSMTPSIKRSQTVQPSRSCSKQPPGRKPTAELSKSFSISTSFSQNTASRKRPREPVHKLSQQIQSQPKPNLQAALQSDLWSDIHKPVSRFDLAVHKKKIDEVAEWLFPNSEIITKHAAPILLLTGPPGAGKTACVDVLCREKGITIHQWENIASQTNEQWMSEDYRAPERSKVDVYSSQSQSSQFQSFLLRANKYSPLILCGSGTPSVKDRKTIILVEEIPNAFLRDSSQLHEILRKYYHTGHCPLIFILTESNSNSSSIQKLFPRDLQQEIRIRHISVNPVAPTMLMKCLQRIVSLETKKGLSVPDQSVVETIAMASGGDIRAALNTLQFACRKDTFDLKSLSPSTLKAQMKRQGSLKQKKKAMSTKALSNGDRPSDPDPTTAIGVKDASVFLFSAIGKILYFKRGNPQDFPDHPKLPKHLSGLERDPLLVNPEDVASKVHLSGDFFTSFLQENYVEFLPSIEDLDRATQYFSDAELMSSHWLSREELQNFAVSVATRGFIHSNSNLVHHDSVRPNQGWRPLHKSMLFNAYKQASQNILSARQLFKGYHWEPEILCTELIPYISLTNPTLHDAGQINFVQDMTQFSRTFNVFSSKLERLNEKDVMGEDEDTSENDVSNNVESQMTTGKGQNKVEAKSSKEIDLNIRDWDEDDGDSEVSNSQRQVKGTVDEEEDLVIEEFED